MEPTLAGTKTRRMHDAALRAQAQAGVEHVNVWVEIEDDGRREHVVVQVRDPLSGDLLTASATSSVRVWSGRGQRKRFEFFNGNIVDGYRLGRRARDHKLRVREVFWKLSDFAAAWEREAEFQAERASQSREVC